MVFVHARKETVKSGMTLHDQVMKEGTAADYDCSDNPHFDRFKRDIGTSRNKEMRELFSYGIGIQFVPSFFFFTLRYLLGKANIL